MPAQDSSRLYDQKQSVDFYEDRYEKGYMDEWSPEKKQKILEVIYGLDLPATGDALDFGCGNGVLTDLIRQALPSWKLFGTDISSNAIANARNRYPDCTFFKSGNPAFQDMRFDFIFTNHVFEHVFDLNEVFNQINDYLKPESSMLHLLPCGNEGSFVHSVCLLREDGINRELQNRFFFEDEGHVRRLTTDELSDLCQTAGFVLQQEYYSNQRYGAIELITSANPKFVLLFTDSSKAIDRDARNKLMILRMQLILITSLRLPVQIVNKVLHTKHKRPKHFALLLPALSLYLFSYPVDSFYKRKSLNEWKMKKHDRRGGGMYLYFVRRK